MATPPRTPAPATRKGPKHERLNRGFSDVKPPSLDKEPLPNFDLLSEEEKTQYRAKAEARFLDREKQRAIEAFIEDELARLERAAHPEIHEPLEDVTIDLAVDADRIILDGMHLMYGRTYKVKRSVAACLREIMFRNKQNYARTHRDPAQAFAEAQRAFTKEGPSLRTISAGGVSF